MPKVISPSDPASAWTAKANKRVQFGYGLNYRIDIENALIVDVEATPARTYEEVAATRTMIERTEARFDLKPKRIVADKAYGTGAFLGWLVRQKPITPHIPVWDKAGAMTARSRDPTSPSTRCATLHLPGRQDADNDREHQHRSRGALQCHPRRLRGLRAQGEVLPQHTRPSHRARHPRGRARRRAAEDEDKGVCAIT